MKIFQTAMIASLAQANLFELDTMFSALTGSPDNNEVIFRKPRIVMQAAPAVEYDLSYSPKVNPLDWLYAVNYSRASTKSFSNNVSGVAPEDLGLWGKTTMKMDENGVNWLTIELEAGWDVRWESHKNYNNYYGGIGWTMQNMENITVVGDSITVDADSQWEFMIQGAKRNTSDNYKSSSPALNFDPLVQVTTGLTSIDLGRTGSQIFGGDIDTDAPTPTSWIVDEVTSSDIVKSKKKYIVGMGVTATRPFIPTPSRSSSLAIKNLNSYAICGKQWIANKNVNAVINEGCTTLEVSLPVPPPEPEVVEPEVQPIQKNEEDSAASLAYSALAAAALFAITY